MCSPEVGDHPAPRRPLQEPELKEVRLVDVLDRVGLLAERDCQRREADRASTELDRHRLEELAVDALEPLQPRLYSISSSPKTKPGRLTLTVDTVRYVINKRKRLGVASTYFAERTQPGERFRAYIQKAHNFALPADPATPIIMVGPGTGIAPFRAFVQERRAVGASGRSWLLFGERQFTHDFLYQLEWQEALHDGSLTRVDLAFSRDQPEKIYVQDRLWQHRRDLVDWIEGGASLYVCGDAKRMAKDVEAAMVDIAAANGRKTTDEAVAFVSQLKKDKRFQLDVY